MGISPVCQIDMSDWERLSPDDFESLCRDLLEMMGFEKVHRLGGAGPDKGRDVICERTFDFGSGITDRYRFIIQCKHYTKSHIYENDLVRPLAQARGKCDNWWLMTTDKLTPNVADWLTDRSSSADYPFKIDYIDREKLETLLNRFLELAVKYFPEKVQALELVHKESMDLMALGRYEEALKILKDKDDKTNPRTAYLLACCFSMKATNLEFNREKYISESFRYLSESSKRGFIEYVNKIFGWPETKCIFEIHRDPELQFIKQHNPKKFNKIFPELKVSDRVGGGGCFAPQTMIKINSESVSPISKLHQGDKVVSYLSKFRINYSEISEICKVAENHKVIINFNLITTLDHRIHTARGWCAVCDLSIGDILTTERGPEIIYSIKFEYECGEVYNLRLSGLPFYYANGYLVHNIKI